MILFASKAEELTKRLQALNSAGQKIGLRINLIKTKVMFNSFAGSDPVNLQDMQIEACSEYLYLGQLETTGEKKKTNKVNRRIILGWSAFGRNTFILKSKMPMILKSSINVS